MEQSAALAAFSALSHETRLEILRLLVRAGPGGMVAGAIADRTNASASRLSFHLQAMEQAGLLSSLKQSRNVIYRVDFDRLRHLVQYLTNDCCGAHPDVCRPARSTIGAD